MSNLIKNQIINSLNNEVTYLQLYLLNGMNYNVHMPNQDKEGAGAIDFQEEEMIISIIFNDGCTQVTHLPYENIIYFNIIKNCPQLSNPVGE